MVYRIRFFILWMLSAILLMAFWFSLPESASSVGRFAACGDINSLKDADSALAKSALRDPFYEQNIIFDGLSGVAHSPTIAQHGDGSIQSIWFAGKAEADADAYLMEAWFVDGKWSEAEIILSAESESRQRKFWINTIGNPVLTVLPDGEAWLFYVTPSAGGWASARISVRKSYDHGKNWGPAQLLQTSPFFNISTLVRQNMLCLDNGHYGLPIHFEMLFDYPILAELNGQGMVVGLSNMFENWSEGIQPLILAGNDGEYEAFLRPTNRMASYVYRQISQDGGQQWSDAKPTRLANPGAPVCGVSFESGERIIAFNNHADRRANFSLAYQSSPDHDWVILDHKFGEGSEKKPYAYCTMMEDRNGEIQLVFSNRKEGEIHHARFNFEWVRQVLK